MAALQEATDRRACRLAATSAISELRQTLRPCKPNARPLRQRNPHRLLTSSSALLRPSTREHCTKILAKHIGQLHDR